MKHRAWQLVSAALIAALFIGKLMPGSWKNIFIQHSPGELSLAAHILLFAAIAFAVPGAHPKAKRWHVLFFALALSGLTETLQFFAVDRHPSLMSVVFDMTGACLGLGLRYFSASLPSPGAGTHLVETPVSPPSQKSRRLG